MSTNESENPDDEQKVYADLDNTPGSSNQVVHGTPVTSELQSNASAGWNHPHPTPYGHQFNPGRNEYTHQQYDPGHQDMMMSQYPQQHSRGQQNLMTSQFQNPESVNQSASNYPIYVSNSDMSSGHMTSDPEWGQSSSNATLGMNPMVEYGPVYDQSVRQFGSFRGSELNRIRSHMTHDVRGHPVTSQYGDMSVENSAMSNLSMTSPSTSIQRHLTPTSQLAPNTGTNRKRKSTSALQKNSGKRKGELTPSKSPHRSEDPNDPLNKEFPDGFKLNTEKLCEEVTEELNRLGISNPHFSEFVLKKSPGRAEKMLDNSKPLDEMRVGAQHNFRRMYNWTKMSESQKQACFRQRPKLLPANEFDAELPDNIVIDTADIIRRVNKEIIDRGFPKSAFAQKVIGKTATSWTGMLSQTIPWYNMTAVMQHNFRRLYNYIEMPAQKKAAFDCGKRRKKQNVNKI